MSTSQVVAEVQGGYYEGELRELITTPVFHLAVIYAKAQILKKDRDPNIIIAVDRLIDEIKEAASFTKTETQEEYELK